MPNTLAVFIFDQAISFNAPLMRVKVELPDAAPWARANTVTDFASAAGAAWTQFAEIAPAMIAVVEEMPRR